MIFAGIQAFGVEIVGSVAVVAVPLIVGWALRKILLRQHVDTLAGQAEIKETQTAGEVKLEKRIAEAEALIRGDLENGIKTKLETIDNKIDAQDVASEKREI